MRLDKRACMQRAELLLQRQEPEALRYAALELRTCMESITYEKLRIYASTVPDSVRTKWQPPQAVKALLEFEPDGDQSFTIHVGKQEDVGILPKDMQLLGQHNALSLKWLRKHYNKVGNLLHAPTAVDERIVDPSEVSSYLSEVVADLKPVISSSIVAARLRFDEVCTFECDLCKGTVIAKKQAIQAGKRAVCFNPVCAAEYVVTITSSDEPLFELCSTKFKCLNCDATVSFSENKVDMGFSFTCPSCRKSHRVVAHQWLYKKTES